MPVVQVATTVVCELYLLNSVLTSGQCNLFSFLLRPIILAQPEFILLITQQRLAAALKDINYSCYFGGREKENNTTS